MLKTVSSVANALGAMNYKGTWNASTNTPTLTSGVGIQGDYYVVSVAGATDLDGITNWGIGDWVSFNGSVWQRIEGGADGNFVNLTVTNSATFDDGLTVASGTVNTNSLTSSGDFTLDVAGDIELNADGSDIVFKDAALSRFTFNLDSTPRILAGGSSLEIETSVDNANIIFKGSDGGTPITALTLDMAEAGAATFSADVTLTAGDLTIQSAGTIQLTQNTTATGDLIGRIEFHDEDAVTGDGGVVRLEAIRGSDKDAPDFQIISSDNAGVLTNRLFLDSGTGDITIGTGDLTVSAGPVEAGAFSLTGATAGAEMHNTGVFSSSKSTVSAASHTNWYNPNGVIGQMLTSGTTLILRSGVSKALQLGANNQLDSLIIDSAENVEITNGDLTVSAGNLTIDNTDNTALEIKRAGSRIAYIGDGGSDNSGSVLLYNNAAALKTFIGGGTSDNYFNGGGGLAIGTTTASGYKLRVIGTSSFTSDMVITAGDLTLSAGDLTFPAGGISLNGGGFSAPAAGEAQLYGNPTLGVVLRAKGTSNDLTLGNSTGGSVLVIPTGTDDVRIPTGDLTVSAGDLVVGATSARAGFIADFQGLNDNGVNIQTGNAVTDIALAIGSTATPDKFIFTAGGDLTVSAGDLVIATSTTPASSTAAGVQGTIAWDANYMYVCTATNNWERVAIASW